MVMRVVSIDGGAETLARARDALVGLSGVVAAEIVPGGAAVKVWHGDELSGGALISALDRTGVRGARAGNSISAYL